MPQLPGRPLLTVMCSTVLVGCWPATTIERHFDRNSPEYAPLHGAKAFPASASNIWLLEDSWQDDMQAVRFDSDLEEARAFARNVTGAATSSAVAETGCAPKKADGTSMVAWWPERFPANAEGASSDGNPAYTAKSGWVMMVPRKDGRARVWACLTHQ